jgi:hypothetical protein
MFIHKQNRWKHSANQETCSWKQTVSLSVTQLMRWESHFDHAKEFLHKISTCNKVTQNLCICCLTSKSRIVLMCVKTFRKTSETRKYFQNHSRRQISSWEHRGMGMMTYHTSRTFAGCTCWVQNAGLLQRLPARAQLVSSLHLITTELLQRRKYGTDRKCSCHRQRNRILRL